MTEHANHNTPDAGGANPAPLDPLERELAALTSPPEGYTPELFARAWDQVHSEGDGAHVEPKVFVLRRWLAPMAVAATLVLVGLAVTTIRTSPGSRPLPELAINSLVSPTAPAEQSFGRPEGAETDRSAAGTRDDRLAFGAKPDLSTTNSARLDEKVASRARETTEASAKDKAVESGKGEMVAPTAQPPAPPAAAPPAPVSQPEGTPKDADYKKSDNTPAPSQSTEKRDELKSVPAPAYRDAGESKSGKPGEPPATDESRKLEDAKAKQDPARVDGELGRQGVPVPGGATSQQRGAAQFDSRGWHRNAGEGPQPAPGPTVVGRPITPAMAGTGGATQPAVTVSWAYRVFVLGLWWWVGIVCALGVLFWYWRRRLIAMDRTKLREPAPDQ